MKKETKKPFNPKCGNDFTICSENGDAKCYRERELYSEKIVRNMPSICDNCVYNNAIEE